MMNYTATDQKFKEVGYTAFELFYFVPTSKEPKRVYKHSGESPELAQEQLRKEVERLPAGTRFEIQAKKNAKDTADTAHVWQFMSEAAPMQGAPGWPVNMMPQGVGFSGFSGFGSMVDPHELKDEKRRLEDLKERLMDERMNLKIEKLQLDQAKEKHAETVAADRAKLAELEKKYTSTAGAAKRGAEMLLGEAIEAFAEKGNFGTFGAKLMGIDAPGNLGEAQEPTSPEHQAIENIAEYIAAQQLTLDQLKQLRGGIAVTIKKWKDGISQE